MNFNQGDDADPSGEIVGDPRRIKIFSLNLNDMRGEQVVGEAWQEDDGTLRGTGIAAVMLFEKVYLEMYKSAAVALNVSPLSLFYGRLSRSIFNRAEFV